MDTVLRILFILPFLSLTFATSWVKIMRPTLIWEEMEVNQSGERIIYCGQFDETYKGRFHWRFNGSSIVPVRTQIHKNKFVFLSSANALRNLMNGEYECCVRETLGNACYSRTILVNNRTVLHNVDISGDSTQDMLAKEGDTYYIRMIDVKRVEAVKCTMNGVNLENFKYPYLGLHTKTVVPYHLKIENIDTDGQVVCDLRLPKDKLVQKKFWIKFGNSSDASSGRYLLAVVLCWIVSVWWS